MIFKWWQKGENMLVLVGPPGTGKTWICAALCELVFNRYNTVRYWKENVFFSRLREAIDRGWDYGATLANLLDDDFVIFDDLGSSPPNDWRKEVIFNMLDLRYNMMKPTVITSNLNRAQITDAYHARCADRLFARENSVVTFWNEESLREKGF